MGTFKSIKTFHASPALIPGIAGDINSVFSSEGFQVNSLALAGGGYDISITKGGLFKAVLGLKSALKVAVQPRGNAIYVEAGVGIFGQQAIPTVITMFVAWPVLIPQIWGMVRQSKLDDRVIAIAESHIAHAQQARAQPTVLSASPATGIFCTSCGSEKYGEANFCAQCGTRFGD